MRVVELRFEGASFHYIFVLHGRLGETITMDLLTIIIILALIGTGVSMALGLLAMSGGGATDRLFSTRLMWTRVGFQAFTLLLVVAVASSRAEVDSSPGAAPAPAPTS